MAEMRRDNAGQGGPGRFNDPVAAYFSAKELIAFRIQIPQALRLYKAIHGNGPKTREEFMAHLERAVPRA